MKTYDVDIRRIEDKLRNMVVRLGNLADENQQLRLKIQQLSDQLDRQKNNVKELQETNKIVKLADGIQTGLSDSEEIKTRISEHIKEIDRCIAILSD